MFVLISKVLDQAHRDLLLSVEISHNGNKILCPLLVIEFSECLLERKELVLPPCISAANTQRCMGTQSPVLTGQRASWREIQGMYTSHLRTCFYTCSSSPATVLHSSTNYSPSNEALFLYLFGNTTASNISTPKAYMQFFFCSHFKQNTHQLLIWIVRLPEHSNEKH